MALILIFGLTLAPRFGVCQTRALAPAASTLFAAVPRKAFGPAEFKEQNDSVPRLIRPTYWKEGALIGGVVGGVGGGLWLYSLCGASCIVSSALLVAIPGAFIGGQFLKPEAASPAPRRPPP